MLILSCLRTTRLASEFEIQADEENTVARETSEQISARLGGFVARPALEQYREKYKKFIRFERENGILQFQLTQDGGPAQLSLPARDAWVQGLLEVSNDPENEVIIITGTGPAWTGSVDPESFARVADGSSDVNYDHFFANTVKLLQHAILSIDVPTIGAINGPGVHTEAALFSDITLCTDTSEFSDGHFGVGVVPGDGLALALQNLIGPKRASYALYTSEVIDAHRALELGLVNEVLSLENLLPRAWELARQIMAAPRVTRRLTHAVVQRPWRRLLQDDFGFHVAHELFGSSLLLADTPVPTFAESLVEGDNP